MAKVSVIIPVYNAEKYLDRCLESVCNQTLKDIEVICVNDCSTDYSLEIIKKYNVKIINLEKNKGAAFARNTGIKAANSEYVGFVDSDDFVDLDFYEKLYDKIIKTNSDIVKGNILNYNPKTSETLLTEFYNMNSKIRENKVWFYYGFTSALYKKNLIIKNKIKFPENIKYFEDPYFSIKSAINCEKIEFVEDAKYYYLDNPSSLSKNYINTDNFYDAVNCINKITEELFFANINEHSYNIIFNFLAKSLCSWCNNLDKLETIEPALFENIINLIENYKFSQNKNELIKNIQQMIPQKYFIKFLRKNLVLSRR